MALLELRDASKTFSGGIEAVKNVTLDVLEGAFLTILGPSGCGKTTLLRLIAGLSQLTSGSILMDGCEIRSPGPERGFVFQEYTSFPWLSVRDNVAFGLRLERQLDEAIITTKAEEMIAAVGLSEFSGAYPGQLSGGQQQRVALARSLAVSPRVLLLDEPFGALDAQTRNDMQLLLLRLWMVLGKTMLFVTHDIEEATFLGQQVVISTPRPFRIAAKRSIRLGEPRTHESKLSEEFALLEQWITRELRVNLSV